MNARALRFPLFDSLRAIAVLLVIGYHALGAVFPPGDPAAIRPYAVQMGVGVSIFFVISGFLLYRPFVAARLEGRKWLPVHAYAWRRFLRIFPGYWVALTVIALWLGLVGVFTLAGIPRYYLLGQVFDVDTLFGGLPQAWSLTVEVGFYIFLPIYAALLGVGRRRDRRKQLRLEWIAVVTLLGAGVVFNVILLSQLEPRQYSPLLRTFPTFVDHFAAGMLLAVASASLQRPERLPRLLRPVDRYPSLAWALALFAFWVVSTQIGLHGHAGEQVGDGQFLLRRGLYVVVAVAVVLPAVFGNQGRGLVRRLLANRVMLYLGLVSYGLFLYHVAVLQQLERWDVALLSGVHPYLRVVDVLLPSLVLASLSYYLIERPALRLKRLVGPRAEPAPAEATAEPAPPSPLTATPRAG
jgi:peptidoglycan/LPS O-acetylase OafA/YrhL